MRVPMSSQDELANRDIVGQYRNAQLGMAARRRCEERRWPPVIACRDEPEVSLPSKLAAHRAPSPTSSIAASPAGSASGITAACARPECIRSERWAPVASPASIRCRRATAASKAGLVRGQLAPTGICPPPSRCATSVRRRASHAPHREHDPQDQAPSRRAGEQAEPCTRAMRRMIGERARREQARVDGAQQPRECERGSNAKRSGRVAEQRQPRKRAGGEREQSKERRAGRRILAGDAFARVEVERQRASMRRRRVRPVVGARRCAYVESVGLSARPPGSS